MIDLNTTKMSSVNERLYDAAGTGRVDQIDACINEGADVNWQNPYDDVCIR